MGSKRAEYRKQEEVLTSPAPPLDESPIKQRSNCWFAIGRYNIPTRSTWTTSPGQINLVWFRSTWIMKKRKLKLLLILKFLFNNRKTHYVSPCREVTIWNRYWDTLSKPKKLHVEQLVMNENTEIRFCCR